MYSATSKDLSENLQNVKRFPNKNFSMVRAAVSHTGKQPVKFIDKGLIMNAVYYKQEILATHLF